MAGLLAHCIDVAWTRGTIHTRRVREPRGASHTALALALTSTHRLNHKHARHAAAACPRPPTISALGQCKSTSSHQSTPKLDTWSYGPARAPARSRCQLSTTAAASEHSSRGGKLGKELPEAAAPRAGSSSRPGRREAAASDRVTSRRLPDFEAAPRGGVSYS